MEPQSTKTTWPPAPTMPVPVREVPTMRLLTDSVEADERIGGNGAYVFLFGFFLVNHLWFMGHLGRHLLFRTLWRCHLNALAHFVGFVPLIGVALLLPVFSLWFIWYAPVAGKMFARDAFHLMTCGVIGFFLVPPIFEHFRH